MADLREQIERDGMEAAYREGRSLPFHAIAALALTLLDDRDQTLSHAAGAPGAAQRSGSPPPQPRHHLGARDGVLSEREREILRLVAQGFSNKAIGRRLYLSASTVNYHLTSAFNKLGAGSRAQAVAVATQRGLL
ncbi:MAG TPA: response regulator transcription factor, partial [Ktedonobacterales bacterium]|nr:response regulator transcription factor [Ktedonobacterales bacterium]